jgi:hypothetical protein
MTGASFLDDWREVLARLEQHVLKAVDEKAKAP